MCVEGGGVFGCVDDIYVQFIFLKCRRKSFLAVYVLVS